MAGFHQSMLLQAPAGCAAGHLVTALQGLLDRHDVLRARLTRSAGVMFQAVWFDAVPGEPGRLLLLVHHLVVDGTSWRILCPELPQLYAAAAEGRPAELCSVGTSFRSWAEHLGKEALKPRRAAELPLWTGTLGADEPPLGRRPLDAVRDTAGTARKLTLPAEHTEPLLTQVPTAFHAGVNDVLLTAFALAVTEWRRDAAAGPGVVLDLEGHGREEIREGRRRPAYGRPGDGPRARRAHPLGRAAGEPEPAGPRSPPGGLGFLNPALVVVRGYGWESTVCRGGGTALYRAARSAVRRWYDQPATIRLMLQIRNCGMP